MSVGIDRDIVLLSGVRVESSLSRVEMRCKNALCFACGGSSRHLCKRKFMRRNFRHQRKGERGSKTGSQMGSASNLY